MEKIANILAALFLSLMFIFMIFSSLGDSAIFDEVAHIGAGFTYLKYQDARLNPEHPPLVKDLAALPLRFLNLKFDNSGEFWNLKNVNDRQWLAGNAFLYEFGNNPDKILFFARLPIMILAILFGWLIFYWIKKRYGNKTALLTVIFYALSPTFIAHSRFVTTDLAASMGFFSGIILFLDFLEKRTVKSLVFCGLVFGVAQLLKFSLILLAPVYLILGILWFFMKKPEDFGDKISAFAPKYNSDLYRGEAEEILDTKSSGFKLFFQLILIFLTGGAVVWAVYAFHVWNYPQSQQLADAKYVLSGYKIPLVANIDFKLIENKFTRPLGQYLSGFLMVARRTAGGNTAYFEGEVSSKGWISYFPTLILAKEQLAFYIFALIGLIFAILNLKDSKNFVSKNFNIFAIAIFIIFYLSWSIWSPLNIGVRHAMPIFPFLYFLAAREIVQWEKKNIARYLISFLLIFWMLAEIVFAFPFYLSYYNILGGGLKNGYLIATDSNYDWGQDLKRLESWINSPVSGAGVEKIYLDYFGGGSPKHYLGDKFIQWQSSYGVPPKGSYFAVSLNVLMGAQGRAVGDVQIRREDSYQWLRGKSPIARAGSSILIYHVN